MNIGIVTAEPYGAYHLMPFYNFFNQSPHSFTHIIPYLEQVQGEPYRNITDDLYEIARSDKLIVTGGSFSAWTMAASFTANMYNVPVSFSELAFIPKKLSPHRLPKVQRASVFGDSSAEFLSEFLNISLSEIVLTGSPSLDNLPEVSKKEGRVLIVSTDDPPSIDPTHELLKTAKVLQNKGFEVIVLTHPREFKPDFWSEFVTSRNSSAEFIATASLVVGFIGSLVPVVASLNIPFIGLDPLGLRIKELPDFAPLCSAVSQTSSHALNSINNAKPVPAYVVNRVYKPEKNSLQKICEFWVS